MKELRYTLLSDGVSDQRLLPILTWLLRQHLSDYALQATWADLRRLIVRPRTMTEKIQKSVELYPCELLFIHRDAESQAREFRETEIRRSLEELGASTRVPPAICVVPVRMQEAWLLFDEAALRKAAGNPNGKQPLRLPPAHTVERLPDPKSDLYDLLREASGLSGRRRKHVPVAQLAYRVADLIQDFAPLRTVPAFNALESEVRQVIEAQGWSVPASVCE